MNRRAWRGTIHWVTEGLTQMKPLSAHMLSMHIMEETWGNSMAVSIFQSQWGAVLVRDSPDGEEVWREDGAG